MEPFIDNHLHPVDACLICSDTFSASHQPVSLPCNHIFGYPCIKRWLRNGRGNTNACPHCRRIMFERDTQANLDGLAIWSRVCQQPPERLNYLMSTLLTKIQNLWRKKPDGAFTVIELLNEAIIPTLVQAVSPDTTQRRLNNDPLIDCYNLVAASWNSLGRPDSATGLAIPFVRLARLISSASTTLPKWLTTVPRTNRLLWKANACIDIDQPDVSWDFINEAIAGNDKDEERYLPLLHLYTVLISQSIANNPQPARLPTRRHEIMNLVVERCCKKTVGTDWVGRPSNDFKDMLVVVFEELRRYQLEKKKPSLRGHDGEESIVRGVWAIAKWMVHKARQT